MPKTGRDFSKLTPLSWSQIYAKSNGYPCLKAKAAQTRQIAEFCLTMARRHAHGDAARPSFKFKAGSRMGPHSDLHCELLVKLFEGFLEFTTSCSASPFVVEDCKSAMYKYLLALGELNKLWR
jgi:hypothetical protein